MWNAIGVLAALALAAFAWTRSRTPPGHYDGEVYGMTPATHRRYAAVALLLALVFALSSFWQALPVIIVWGVTVVVALLYLTSFLRGAESDV